jgi:hypothetical protein
LERNQKEEWSSSHFPRLAGDDVLIAKDCFHHRTCRYFKELPLNPKINFPLEPYPKIAALTENQGTTKQRSPKEFFVAYKRLEKVFKGLRKRNTQEIKGKKWNFRSPWGLALNLKEQKPKDQK